jgi:hypothetical protein
MSTRVVREVDVAGSFEARASSEIDATAGIANVSEGRAAESFESVTLLGVGSGGLDTGHSARGLTP